MLDACSYRCPWCSCRRLDGNAIVSVQTGSFKTVPSLAVLSMALHNPSSCRIVFARVVCDCADGYGGADGASCTPGEQSIVSHDLERAMGSGVAATPILPPALPPSAPKPARPPQDAADAVPNRVVPMSFAVPAAKSVEAVSGSHDLSGNATDGTRNGTAAQAFRRAPKTDVTRASGSPAVVAPAVVIVAVVGVGYHYAFTPRAGDPDDQLLLPF